MNTVCIVKGKDPYTTTRTLLRKLNFQVKGKKVLIKPNLTTNANSQDGITTDVNVVRAILERLNDCDVTIGECSCQDTEYSFEVNGYYDLEDFDVKLKDMNKDIIVWKRIPKPFKYKKLPFAKTALDCEYLINVSKLKVHALTTITLSLKNLFGTVPKRRNRVKIHPFISKAICDIIQVIKSNFNVIDGIVGNQYDEVISNPVNSGIVIGGYDALSVDLVGCECMGISPGEVEHLRLAQQLLGSRDINVIGERIDDVKKVYKRKRLPRTTLRYTKERAMGYLYRIIGS